MITQSIHSLTDLERAYERVLRLSPSAHSIAYFVAHHHSLGQVETLKLMIVTLYDELEHLRKAYADHLANYPVPMKVNLPEIHHGGQ